MPTTAEELADRVFASALGAVETYSIHIGDRLGFYRALAPEGKTSAQLSPRRVSTSVMSGNGSSNRRPMGCSTST